MPNVIPLADANRQNASLVGGKAASLGELLAAGFPVPPGFVVTTSAFRQHGAAVPETVADEVLAAFDAAGFEQCAVRSSAVGEDGPERSFAGQHATLYGVTRARLLDSIAHCWASLESDHARAYRDARFAPEPSTGATMAPQPMAVLIQAMIPADSAGVCFTSHPAHDDNLLVEACWGLGAALVDGRVTPDQFELTQDLETLKVRTGIKRHRVSVNGKEPEATRLDPLPVQLQQRRCLGDDQVRAVAALAQSCRDHFGTEQDVEWAYADGHLVLLQSRPITSGPPAAPAVPPDEKWVEFQPVAENFSEAMTPLTQDIVRRLLPPFGRFLNGRYHINARLLSWLIPFKLTDEALRDLLTFRAEPADARIDPVRLAVTLAAVSGVLLTNGVFLHRTAHLPDHVLTAFARLCREVAADVRLGPVATLRKLFLGARPFRPIGQYAFQINVSSVRYFLLMGVLRGLLERWAPTFDASKIGALCSGSEQMHSRNMVLALRDVAGAMRDEHELLTHLDAGNTTAALSCLDALPADHGLSIAYTRFLDQYGHRGVRELDFIAPRWREQPAALLAMLRSTTRHADSVDAAHDLYGLHLAARDALHEAMPSAWQRFFVDRLVARIRYYVALRENTRHFHSMAFAVVRDKILTEEHDLRSAGQLRCADDIFFLLVGEIDALRSGAMTPLAAERVIRRRRRVYQAGFHPKARSHETTSNAGDPMTGQCASPGFAEGPARVIHDPMSDAPLEPGEILVAPYTDPAWTPMFPVAAGIVVEVGSYLSHAGTLAREFGVACLVDVAGATSRIRTGQQIRVDAYAGVVEVME